MRLSTKNLGRRSMMLVALVFMTLSAVAADLNWTFTFAPADINLSASGQYTVITLADGSNPRDAVGAPAIPAKFANILLPSGATDVTISATGDLVLLASDVTPWPTQRVAPKSKKQPPFAEPDPVAYASANPWPAVAATYEGLHEMQGSTFVSVRVNPLVYVASEKALYYRPQVTVTVSYNEPDAQRNNMRTRLGATAMVNALVVNPSTTDAALRSPSLVPASDRVDYLIITSNSLKTAFQALADYRATGIGGSYKTLVVTTEDIKSNYSGGDTQEKIRNCIKDYYQNHGTTFVVLGGDDTIVPDRDTYVEVGYDVESHMPTDLYYSDLTGTWKADGDKNYGVTEANVDMSPDVIVGRIPVRTADQATGYIAKVQAFENDLTYTRNSIIMGGPSAWNTYSGSKRPSDDVTGDGHADFRASNHSTVSDSEMWLRRLYRDGIKKYWDNAEQATGRTINLACDYITSWDGSTCGDKPLNATNMKKWLNNGYTHMMFSGHGFPQGWGLESGYYSTDEAASQTNLTAFVYTDACLTGAFDQTGEDEYGNGYISYDGYPDPSEPCLGEAFIRNPNGGSLVHMGCARYGWGTPDEGAADDTSDGGPSTVYGYKFYKRLYEQAAIAKNRTVGEAFAMSKADMISQCRSYGCERWIQFGLNYLGDPAIALYPREDPDDPDPNKVPATPKNLEVSELAANSFTASWSTIANALSYEVDVVKGSDFAESSDEPVLQEDFTDTTGWTLNGTGTYTGSGYYGASAPAIKFDSNDDYIISPEFSSGARLQFWALGNNGSGSTFDIDGYVNGHWTDAETVTIEKGGKTYEVDLPAGTKQVRFTFKKSVNCALDDVVVYPPSNSPEGLPGYPKSVTTPSADITDLTPNTQYAVRVRAVNAVGSSNWSSTVTATTALENSVPVWTAFPDDASVHIGDVYQLNISEFATGTPAPTFAMTASGAENATFNASSGMFAFTPTTVGTYDFTFSATNVMGAVSSTLTVTVLPAPVHVPTLTVTEADITASTAPVAWNECQDVTEYTLQLASDDQFAEGGAGEAVTLIENGATSATAPADWTYNISNKTNSYLVLLEGHSVVSAAFSALAYNKLVLTLKLRTYGGTSGTSNTLLVEYSADGTNWVELGTISASTNSLVGKTLDISKAIGNQSVRLRFTDPGATSGQGVGLSDIVVTGTLPPTDATLISTTAVEGTSYTFTGLTPNTTYYARVKGNADWSNVVSFTTTAAATIELADNGTDNASIIMTNHGKKANVTLAGRTFYKDGEWNTVCLPFDLPLEGSPLADAEAKMLTDATMTGTHVSLHFGPAQGTLEAGVPYIIRWTGGDNIVEPTFTGVTIDDAMQKVSLADGNVQFTGYYDAFGITADDTDIYYMGTGSTLKHTAKPRTLKACRAYFRFTPEALSRDISIDFGEGEAKPTGVGAALMNSEERIMNNEVYDLQGRRIDGARLNRGIYIKNGRKVVVK